MTSIEFDTEETCGSAYWAPLLAQPAAPVPCEAIFSPPHQSWPFSRKATHDKTIGQEKTAAFTQPLLAPRKPCGWSAEVKAEIGWGGGEIDYNASFSGSVSDDNGNKIEGKVEHGSDGGSASISAKHEDTDNDNSNQSDNGR